MVAMMSPHTWRPQHIVQVGYDDSVFRADAPSDTTVRQLLYGRVLQEIRPGSRLSLLTFTANADAKRFERENVVFIPVLTPRCRDRGRLYGALTALHRERPIDVVATQTIYEDAWIAKLFGKRYRIPTVEQVHFDIFSDEAIRAEMGGGIFGRARAALGLRLMRRSHAVRVVSRALEDGIRKRNLHWNVRNIPVPVTMDAAEGAGAGRRVMFVGRLVAAKNVGDWMRVAAKVAAADGEAEFVVAGDGPLREEMESLANQMGIADRVRFAGAVPYDKLREMYRESAALLLTSRYEGFGRVVVEAALNGAPTVAARVAGTEDTIADGVTGFLHAQGDVDGMAASAVKLLKDNALRKRMGEAARDMMRERFAPERLAREWMGLLAETGLGGSRVIVPPLRATFGRWRKLSTTRYSLLRGLQYERIEELKVSGTILDMGGGAAMSYLPLISVDGRLVSVNIAAKVKPSVVGDLNAELPFKDNSFDGAISLNTLEHIREDALCVREMLRVLRPGARFHILVPFLFHIHSEAGDYNRRTAYWWEDYLTAHGVSPEKLVIEPLVWDPKASAFSIVEFGRFRAARKRIAMLRAVLAHTRWRGERIPELNGKHYAEFALGYYIHGEK